MAGPPALGAPLLWVGWLELHAAQLWHEHRTSNTVHGREQFESKKRASQRLVLDQSLLMPLAVEETGCDQTLQDGVAWRVAWCASSARGQPHREKFRTRLLEARVQKMQEAGIGLSRGLA